MDESSGRGRREKIPSAKLQEQLGTKSDKLEDNKKVLLPTYIANDDLRFYQEQKEIPKSYDHTKTGANGERYDFYTLGNHVESKDKRCYLRARRDDRTYYFHADEAPPRYARFSDENHASCFIEAQKSVFTKDMLGKSGEFGSYTSKANVFAREGQYYFEARIISQHPPGKEPANLALAALQNPDKSSTKRGGLRLGFCRREHHWGEPLGTNAYSYCLLTRSGHGAEYGCVRFQGEMRHMSGEGAKEVGDLSPGDVVGLMITLPSLEVHKKVVDGTFNAADYPDLKCGPAQPAKAKKSSSKKGVKSKTKAIEDTDMKNTDSTTNTSLHTTTSKSHDISILPDHDIIRDRNPFNHKGMTYFESPEYTPHPDLSRDTLNSKNKTVNPDTKSPYDLETNPHPNHDLPHLRTLPGSKIECWVNGVYHGVVWEHLFAFLPPASFIEKSNKTTLNDGFIDDGLLGYYPAVTHYTGGAVECKFDEPWWCGFEKSGPTKGNAQPIGVRYKEQIVEDFVADMVDEVYQERLHGDPDWMRRKVRELAPVKAGHE